MQMLSERQRRFIAALRAGADPAGAAEAAGYSPGRARRQAVELLRRPEIAAAVQAPGDAGDEPVSAGRVVKELARIAFADAADLAGCGDDGACPRGSGTGLKVKYTPRRAPDGGTVMDVSLEREVRVGDKLRALELLTKVLGLGAGEEDAPAGGVVILPEVMAAAPREEA